MIISLIYAVVSTMPALSMTDPGRHGDGKVNFDVKLMVCVDKTDL